MPNEGNTGERSGRIPVGFLVRVKLDNVEEFAEQFAVNIGPGGIFLQSRKPHPPGTLLHFEIRLSGGQTVLKGRGEVVWSRAPTPPGEKPKVPGMGVKFLALDAQSQALVKKVLAKKESAIVPASIERSEAAFDPNEFDIDVDLQGEEPSEAPEPATANGIPLLPLAQPRKLAMDGESSEEGTDPRASRSEPLGTAQTQTQAQLAASLGKGPIHLGVDFGSCFTRVAVVRNGKPFLLPTRRGARAFPSVVAYTSDGRVLTGTSASAQLDINPKNTICNSKALMGRPFECSAVRDRKDRLPCRVAEDADHETAVTIAGTPVNFTKVVGYLFSEVRAVAQESLRAPLHRCVLAVPATASVNQRRALIDAARESGLGLPRLVSESAAAALAYGWGRNSVERLLVFGLGGGGFGVSVIEMCQNVFETVAMGGDPLLGGLDFDAQLFNHLLEAFFHRCESVPAVDPNAIQHLRQAAGVAKCALSTRFDSRVHIPQFATVKGVPRDLDLSITRATFEQLVSPLIEKAVLLTLEVLERAHLAPEQIDSLLLVGGQCRTPLLRQRLQEIFRKSPVASLDVEEAIAIGAAYLAHSEDQEEGVVVIESLPTGIGLGAMGGRFVPILPAGSTLPTTKTLNLKTFKDGQSSWELHLFQGESAQVVDSEYLGSGLLTGVTPAPKGQVTLEVNLGLSSDGLLEISARELPTRQELNLDWFRKLSRSDLFRKLQIAESPALGEARADPQNE